MGSLPPGMGYTVRKVDFAYYTNKKEQKFSTEGHILPYVISVSSRLLQNMLCIGRSKILTKGINYRIPLTV